ncbi:unnamed protein product [Linum trigynum]|uniref:Uncharacterized protein n=1 Tax=Linum trigynum TaxID=586398 RepID=A0AAV2FVF5_9ROSI
MLAEAYHLVTNDEQQRLIASSRRPRPEAAGFQAHGEKKMERASLLVDHDRNKEHDADGNPRCSHCKHTEYVKETCYRLISFPPMNNEKEEPFVHDLIVELVCLHRLRK